RAAPRGPRTSSKTRAHVKVERGHALNGTPPRRRLDGFSPTVQIIGRLHVRLLYRSPNQVREIAGVVCQVEDGALSIVLHGYADNQVAVPVTVEVADRQCTTEVVGGAARGREPTRGDILDH